MSPVFHLLVQGWPWLKGSHAEVMHLEKTRMRKPLSANVASCTVHFPGPSFVRMRERGKDECRAQPVPPTRGKGGKTDKEQSEITSTQV